MNNKDILEIFVTTAPGLETLLSQEMRALEMHPVSTTTGGVTFKGDWPAVWRANLLLRGASRVLVRLSSFSVVHLAKLDKLARRLPWRDILRLDVPVRVDVTTKKSRIYHHKAAAERIETAIRQEVGVTVSQDADVCLKVRIYDDLCTISVDTSGEALHKRGYKEAVNKAPMRENMAALLLRACDYNGQKSVVDPLCGSGTFIIEAAEIAKGLMPGRARSFAFEKLATFDITNFARLRESNIMPSSKSEINFLKINFYGYDRDAGAIKMSQANSKRAHVDTVCCFNQQTIGECQAPSGPEGLVITNPPYGKRIGDTKRLAQLYHSMGKQFLAEFKGWRIGIITNSDRLAKATNLPFSKHPLSFDHGGMTVKLYQTKPL